MSFNTVNLGENWQIQNDIQYRSFNAVTDMEQLMLRGGIGYNLSDKNNNLLLLLLDQPQQGQGTIVLRLGSILEWVT